jgi:CRP-like cAMP-binding protein
MTAPAESPVPYRTRDRSTLIAIPPGDRLFRRVVARCVRSVRSGTSTLRGVRRELRLRFPDAELNRQRDVRVRDDSVEVWFAYRDGHEDVAERSEPWWEGKGLARIVVDSSGRLSGANEHGRSLLEIPGRGEPQPSLRDLISPELTLDLCASARSLSSVAELTGAMTLRLPSGKRLDVEYHAVADASRKRRRVTFRTFAERDLANDLWAVRHSSLGTMPQSIQQELVRGATRHKLAPGERLSATLTQEPWAVLVTAGIVRVYVATDGFEPTVLYGNVGMLLGTHALIAEPYLVGLQAVTASSVLQLRPPRISELAETSPAFARAVSSDIQLQLTNVVASFAARSSANLKQRLAREIAVLSNLQGGSRLVPVTEQQLADGVGSIRESVARTIAQLRAEGSIVTTRHGLVILDRASLRRTGLAAAGG